jgi:hypothetical protein
MIHPIRCLSPTVLGFATGTAKYVSIIILTTFSAFPTMSTLDSTRILLIKAYTCTKADTSASLRASASAYSFAALCFERLVTQ